jgi:hypothetical protein
MSSASSPWKNNFLTSYGQLFNSAMTSHVTPESFPVAATGILPTANIVTPQTASPYVRCIMQQQQQQQQQQQLRHHAKSLFG